MHTERICPLCEKVFSTVISQEEFQDHVMEHFNGDGQVLAEFQILDSYEIAPSIFNCDFSTKKQKKNN